MKLYETITAENWCKIHYWERGGVATSSDVYDRACISGHSIAMADGHEDHVARMDKVRLAIGALFPDRGNHHVLFNDHPDTTFEDIQRVLKFADV